MNWENIISNRFYDYSKSHARYLGIFSMLGMGVGCFAIIISISVMNGFETLVHKKLKGFEGDIRVYDGNLEREWEKLDGIELIIPFMERRAVLESDDSKRVALIKAIDQEIMQSFYDFYLRGSFPKSGEVIIGQDLAYRLGRKLGDEITVYSPIDHTIGLSIPKKKSFMISGIFSTKLLDYDDQLIFITLNDGKILFKRKENIDGYDIRVNKNYLVENVKANIKNLIDAETIVLSWDDQNRSLVDAMRMERYGTIIILSLIFLVAVFNLAANLTLISMQKMREIGILRVMGASKYSIFKIIMRLGFRRAGIGVLFGFIFGILIIIIQRNFSIIPLPTEVYFTDSLPMMIYLKDIILVLVLSFCFIYFGSYFSGRKLSKLNIVEAIQWVK